MDLLHDIATNPILFSAFLTSLLASVVSGIIGSYVVVKRITFICGSIAHAVLGGIGLSLWLSRAVGWTFLTPLAGSLFAALIAAGILGWIRTRFHQREDTIIATLWTIGMSVGIIFISLTPGYNVELMNFLIGNILWVAPHEMAFLFALDFIVVLSVLCLHKRFLAICFDEDQARLQGLHVDALYFLLLVFTAISVVLLVQVVGIILAMTLLTIPAALANLFTSRLSHMMAIAVFLCASFSFCGIGISYYLDWPSGATIALLAGVAYTLILPLPIGMFRKSS